MFYFNIILLSAFPHNRCWVKLQSIWSLYFQVLYMYCTGRMVRKSDGDCTNLGGSVLDVIYLQQQSSFIVVTICNQPSGPPYSKSEIQVVWGKYFTSQTRVTTKFRSLLSPELAESFPFTSFENNSSATCLINYRHSEWLHLDRFTLEKTQFKTLLRR